MSDEQSPPPGAPAEGDDLLRRVAQEIRRTPELGAWVPLTGAERERITDRAIEVAGLPGGATGGAGSWWRRLFGARVAWAGAAALALAGIALVALRPRPAEVAPLGAYSLALAGERELRSDPASPSDGPVEFRPSTAVTLTLTAAQPERDARLRLLLVRGDRATVLEPTVSRSKDGVLTLEGQAGELFGAQGDGPAELVVVLGRELPADELLRAMARGAAPAPRYLQVLRSAVVLVDFSHTAVDVLLGGCGAVLDPPEGLAGRARCELGATSPLRLWVGAGSPTEIEVLLGGQLAATPGRGHRGGTLFELAPPAVASELVVRVADRAIATWQLLPAPRFPRIQAAAGARVAGELDRASAALDQVDAQAPAEEQLAVVRERAKLANRRGDSAAEQALRERAVTRARSLARISDESDEIVAIVFGLLRQHELGEAARWLRDLDAHGDRYAEGAVRRELVRGLWAIELGDLGAALGALRRSLELAERVGDDADRAVLLAPMAEVLQALGRAEESRAAILAELERADQVDDPCVRVDALTSAGWLLRELDGARAQELAEQAAKLAAEHCAPQLPIALVNQGWILSRAGVVDQAQVVLARLQGLPGSEEGRVATWALRLHAEILLAQDPGQAVRYAQQLAARAEALCSTELAYEAHLLRARGHAALGQAEAAAAAFAEAEQELSLWSRLVPLGEGRDTFFVRHDELARTAIPFFLSQVRADSPHAARALAMTVRRSLARFVTSVGDGGRARADAERGEASGPRETYERAHDRWAASPAQQAELRSELASVCAAREAAQRRSGPELAATPGAAALFVHPFSGGQLVVAWRGASIKLAEVAAPGEGTAELTARLADAAAALLRGAGRVHLHVHRSLVALPLDRRLAASLGVPVAFAMEATGRSTERAAEPCRAAPRALLVSDPLRNLWAASAAAPRVQRELTRLGLEVDVLEGERATRAAVLERLRDPCTTVFHYDGHAAAGPGGARLRDRIDDALLLARGERLSADDVGRLERAPASVILNGCTTAAREGLGLAQAFLVAGSAQVVASLEELPAAQAAAFSEEFYVAADGGGELDLAALFYRAAAGGDLPALRVFER